MRKIWDYICSFFWSGVYELIGGDSELYWEAEFDPPLRKSYMVRSDCPSEAAKLIRSRHPEYEGIIKLRFRGW